MKKIAIITLIITLSTSCATKKVSCEAYSENKIKNERIYDI